MTTRKWYNGLRFQILVLLTLALLPLGAIAVHQTGFVEQRARQDAAQALLALTTRAARSEALLLEQASGVVKFVAATAQKFIETPAHCAALLPRFVQGSDGFSFIGIIPPSGIVTCSSADRILDFSDWPELGAVFESQRRTLVVDPQGPASGTSVFVLSEPFFTDGTFGGFVSLSIPHDSLPEPRDDMGAEGLVELLTFNGAGDILTWREGDTARLSELPRDLDLAQLRSEPGTVSRRRNREGVMRIYTVVPIAGSPATVLGIWRADDTRAAPATALLGPALFPGLMWIASMGVAMLSIHTLVLRHLSRLRRRMDRFSQTRSISQDRAAVMPYEIQALSENFDNLTDAILREEARLEDTLHEKNVLIKEVHHRVKNNLQLIASLMNMQIRAARHRETRAVLSRVQDRVLSLATIHRNLYQSQDGGRVNARGLVVEIVQNSVELATADQRQVDLDMQVAPVLLYPDQAVPLSLITAEAMTNAMKNLCAAKGVTPWLRVTLSRTWDDCLLRIENSVCDLPAPPRDPQASGLGTGLMEAFALQLDGALSVDHGAGRYALTVTFTVQAFAPETRDY